MLTPRDQNLNYSSPGNIIQQGGEWVLCLQTYARENDPRGGFDNFASIGIAWSGDLEKVGLAG